MCRVPTVNTVGTVLYGDILSFSSCLIIHLCQSRHVDSFLLDYSLDLLNFPSHIVLLLTIADVLQCFWWDLTHVYHCRVFLFLFVLLTIPHISILLSCFRSLLCILWVRIELALSLTFWLTLLVWESKVWIYLFAAWVLLNLGSSGWLGKDISLCIFKYVYKVKHQFILNFPVLNHYQMWHFCFLPMLLSELPIQQWEIWLPPPCIHPVVQRIATHKPMRNNSIAQFSNCEAPLTLTHTVLLFPRLLMSVTFS